MSNRDCLSAADSRLQSNIEDMNERIVQIKISAVVGIPVPAGMVQRRCPASDWIYICHSDVNECPNCGAALEPA